MVSFERVVSATCLLDCYYTAYISRPLVRAQHTLQNFPHTYPPWLDEVAAPRRLSHGKVPDHVLQGCMYMYLYCTSALRPVYVLTGHG